MGITLDDAKLFSGGSLIKKKPNVWVLSYFAHTFRLSLTCMQWKPIRTISMRSFLVKSCMSYLPPLCCRTFFRGVSSRDERNVPSFLTRLIVVKRYFSSADALRFLCWFFFRWRYWLWRLSLHDALREFLLAFPLFIIGSWTIYGNPHVLRANDLTAVTWTNFNLWAISPCFWRWFFLEVEHH